MGYKPRFGQAHEAYHAFRPPYPPECFKRILEAVPPGRRDRATDLGAGTGLSALPLCEWFAEVIAIEPDPLMAQKLAGQRPNLIVGHTTAEECILEPESMDLVTCGTAFHWMDGPRVLHNVLRWLRREGVLGVYQYGFPRTPRGVQAILAQEMKLHWEAFRHPRLRDKGYSRRVLEACAGLHDLRVLSIPNPLRLQPQHLVGFCRSTSYGSAYLRTLGDPETYLRELETAFHEAAPNDMIPVDFDVELILAHKA